MKKASAAEVRGLYRFLTHLSNQLFSDELKSMGADTLPLRSDPLLSEAEECASSSEDFLSAEDLGYLMTDPEPLVNLPTRTRVYEGYEKTTLQENVRHLLQLHHEMQYDSREKVAIEVLTGGLDLKAIFGGAPFRSMDLKGLHLPRCDASTLNWENVTASHCDFSNSLFYQTSFQNCLFQNCVFSCGVWKKAVVRGHTFFEDCTFNFSALSMQVIENRCVFSNCDFDLCDFDGFEAKAPKSTLFHNCYNLNL